LQALAQIALIGELPEHLKPSQVRSAMTAVIRKMIEAPGTFDNRGWLRIGFCGHQPLLAEDYISTGSLYLCAAALLPLGLPLGHRSGADPRLAGRRNGSGPATRRSLRITLCVKANRRPVQMFVVSVNVYPFKPNWAYKLLS